MYRTRCQEFGGHVHYSKLSARFCHGRAMYLGITFIFLHSQEFSVDFTISFLSAFGFFFRSLNTPYPGKTPRPLHEECADTMD